MILEQKPDFEKVLQRFEAWWHCELVDRPLVTMSVKPPKPGPAFPAKSYSSMRERWMDIDYKLDQLEAGLPHRVFVAESFPMFMPNLGPEICSTIFGAELEFGEITSWSIPVAKNVRDILTLKLNLANPYWNWIRRATDLSVQRGKGKWITGVTDLHTNGDLPASLRDPQNLCMDLMDDPDGVAAATEYVTNFFADIYNDLWKRIESAGQPSTTWAPALHRGSSYVTSCDFICMISPAMFEKTIQPSLRREMRLLKRNFFHLDGPAALRHLDALLAMPELNGLQWTYGAGHGPARQWVEVYQKAQRAGKCLQVIAQDLHDAEALMEHLRPQGVWFTVSGSYTLDEANAFIRRLEAWATHHR